MTKKITKSFVLLALLAYLIHIAYAILGISEYSVSIPMYDGDKQLDKKGTLTFGDEQVSNKLMQIIYLSKNDNYQSLTVTDQNLTAVDCDLIEAKHQLPYSSDRVTDFAPRDVSRAASVSVGKLL